MTEMNEMNEMNEDAYIYTSEERERIAFCAERRAMDERDDEEPLIYTNKGNVPIANLTREVHWDVQDSYIKMVEIHRDASGELVKESSWVYDKRGISASAIAASLG